MVRSVDYFSRTTSNRPHLSKTVLFIFIYDQMFPNHYSYNKANMNTLILNEALHSCMHAFIQESFSFGNSFKLYLFTVCR